MAGRCRISFSTVPDSRPCGRLHGPDNWKDTQEAEIEATGNAPANDAEAAILTTLAPESYSRILRGQNDTTRVALLKFYK